MDEFCLCWPDKSNINRKKLWKYAADKDKDESQTEKMSQKTEGEIVLDP